MSRVLTEERKLKAEERSKIWSSLNRDKINSRMREYRAKRYQLNGRWLDEGVKAKELKAWMIKLKSKPCTDCHNTYPVCCMDFDHKTGSTKVYNVGSMFAHHYSRELIEIEIDKCDLVCANCHRIRTQSRKLGEGLWKN